MALIIRGPNWTPTKKRIELFLTHRNGINIIMCYYFYFIYCGRQEEPAILISKHYQYFLLFFILLLRAPLVARNSNLQVVITHALHVCSQHLFGLPQRMSGMHGEATCVLTICHVNPTQSIATEQNNFDLRSLLHSLTFGYY